MPDIVHTVEIATTPDRLYDALTTQGGLAGWWTPQATAAPPSIEHWNLLTGWVSPAPALKVNLAAGLSVEAGGSEVIWGALDGAVTGGGAAPTAALPESQMPPGPPIRPSTAGQTMEPKPPLSMVEAGRLSQVATMAPSPEGDAKGPAS